MVTHRIPTAIFSPIKSTAAAKLSLYSGNFRHATDFYEILQADTEA